MKNYIRYIIFAVIFIVVVVTTIIASCFFVSWYENKPRNCAPPKGKKLVDEKWREAIDVEDSQPESFKEFILHNNTPVLLDDLYKNLDQESIRILDMMLIKVMNLPDTKYAKYFLMDYAFTKSLKNKRELAYLKHRNENYQKVLKKYKFVDGYPGSSRLFINKLNFIDTNQKTLDYIKSSLVLPILKDGKVSYLAAFIVVNGNINLSGRELTVKVKNDLKALIPSYMVPRKIKAIEKFPLNTNGKIDRKKLLEEF